MGASRERSLSTGRSAAVATLLGLGLAFAVDAAPSRAETVVKPPPWWRVVRALQGKVSDLEGRVAALEAGGAPVERLVNCGAGETVAAALALGARTWGPLTITIVGTCREAVVIARDDTTLRGASAGDGLDGTTLGQDLVEVAAQRVALRQLTLRTHQIALRARPGAALEARDLDIDGADFGVYLDAGAIATVTNATIRNSVNSQVMTQGANLRLEGCLIEDGGSGVSVGGGTASIWNCTIRRHSTWGVSIYDNANASVFESEIRGNSSGVYMTTGASGMLGAGVTVAGNRAFGIQERDGSVLYLGGGLSIQDNPQGGVWVTGGSFVLPLAVTIQNNGGSGIYLGDTSVAGSWNASNEPIIRNNSGWGIACAGEPAVAQVQPTGYPVGTVTGNTLGASNCPGFGDPGRVP
jgi:hypothetical protein